MIIFIYGADTFRSRRFLTELKDKFKRDVDPDAISLVTIDGSNASLASISEKIGAGSLFVKKRFVAIEGIFNNKKEQTMEELEAYLKKLDTQKSEDIIVFREESSLNASKLKKSAKKLFSFLVKQPYSQEFKSLTPDQLISFIAKEAAIYDKKIGRRAADILAARTGGDLWLLAGAIKKISYAQSGSEIKLETIKDMVEEQYDENIFALTDTICSKDKKKAAALLEEQYLAGASEEYILAMLIRQARILVQVKSALDSGISPQNLATTLKLHPFVAKKSAAQAKNFSNEDLKSLFNQLLKLDWQLKTGQGELKTSLVLFISAL